MRHLLADDLRGWNAALAVQHIIGPALQFWIRLHLAQLEADARILFGPAAAIKDGLDLSWIECNYLLVVRANNNPIVSLRFKLAPPVTQATLV